MNENDISYSIRGSIFTVYNKLGPGLLESAYEAALIHEIRKTGLLVKQQIALPMIYETIKPRLRISKCKRIIKDFRIIPKPREPSPSFFV